MRGLTDGTRIREFMVALGREALGETRVYFTGGVCAVLEGWRASTIDADIRMVPERDELFRALVTLKEQLQMNVELASPPDFIPELPGWAERSPFVAREGLVSFHHFDFYSQALAKIERGHAQDEDDVKRMLESGRVEPAQLRAMYDRIEPLLVRYPAVDPVRFRRRLDETLAGR